MGEELLADIVGLVRETFVIKKKDQGLEDLPFPKSTRQKKSDSESHQLQPKILKQE